MGTNKKKLKVIVGMSGGVDSSVSAALLKQAGFDVVGVMAKFWKESENSGENRCCSVESEKLARLVAKQLDIPFYVVNLEKEFKKKVVDYFLKEYKAGNTPNPCVVCNKEIKFGLLMEKAFKMGGDFIATGHYARISPGNQIFSRLNPSADGAHSPQKNLLPGLFKGRDVQKDQSYFLCQLNQKQLSKILFPVGGYTKPEVRKLAKKFDLPTAETPESQEVCFVQNTTNDFLKKYFQPKAGSPRAKKTTGTIVDTNGKELGEHQGFWFYTIGQRRGLEIPQGPWYVVDKDFKKNVLIVSKNEKDLFKKELIVKDVNWINKQKLPLTADVKIRYKSRLAKAKIEEFKKDKIKITFSEPQKAITSGQSAVFYKKDELLGGGTIL